MESRKFELILHSAKGLNKVKHIGTMDPYAVIWIAGDAIDCKHRTNTVKNGGSDPVWDSTMEFNVEQDAFVHNHYVLVCEINHDGTLHDRKIGQVQVPLRHLLLEDATGEKVGYPVMLPSGELKGEIILSYKLKENIAGDVSGTLAKKVHQSKNRTGGIVREVMDASLSVVESVAGVLSIVSGSDRDD